LKKRWFENIYTVKVFRMRISFMPAKLTTITISFSFIFSGWEMGISLKIEEEYLLFHG
jgi:hypothetical protein